MSYRTRSPAPPPPPPKDTSNGHGQKSRSHSTNNTSASTESRYVNVDLAEAVRDSVHIGSSSLAPPPPTTSELTNINETYLRRTPSPLPPGAGTSFQPSHGYSKSSPDMSSMAQPQLPSQRIATATTAVQNPFEQDEVEPVGNGRLRPPGAAQPALGIEGPGVVPVSRAKFSRAATG